jgi:hypothetical protein
VQRVTGWTTAQLRAEPARVVRAHFARIFAGLVWSPELAEAARSAGPPRASFGSLGDYANARAAKGQAIAAFDTLTAALWPEDDDG